MKKAANNEFNIEIAVNIFKKHVYVEMFKT